MLHKMRLFDEPYESIKARRKTVEVRLNDEKRRKISPGDTIEFMKLPDELEKLQVRVIDCLVFDSFRQLYEEIPREQLDCAGKDLDDMVQSTYRIYTPEQEQKLGVLGIRIELC